MSDEQGSNWPANLLAGLRNEGADLLRDPAYREGTAELWRDALRDAADRMRAVAPSEHHVAIEAPTETVLALELLVCWLAAEYDAAELLDVMRDLVDGLLKHPRPRLRAVM